MADAITVIHVSDLHLDEPITEPGRRLRIKSPGTKTHAYYLLSAASHAVKRLMLLESEHPVILVVSGDLTTRGTSVAFGLAEQVVSRGQVAQDGSIFPVGLNAGIRHFVIPGNHDRWHDSYFRRQETAFETVFREALPIENWEEYGLSVPVQNTSVYPRLPYAHLIKSNGVAGEPFVLVVIGVDSTELSEDERRDLVGRAARGRVSERSLAFIRNVCQDLFATRRVTTSDGIRHRIGDMAFRTIVLLHHHPYLPFDQKFSGLTKLINADDVLNSCAESGVDLLLFGHEHLSFIDSPTLQSASPDPRRIICAAAGSLCVFGEPRGNSFNVYRIGRDSMDYEKRVYDRHIFRASSYSGTYHFQRRQ